MKRLLLLLAVAACVLAQPPSTNARRLQGRAVCATAPADTQVLGWNAASACWTPIGTVAAWKSYTIPYTDAAFKAAATAVSVVLFELPAKGAIEGIRLKHSVAFAGTGITSVTCSLGDGTSHTAYAPAFDVFQAVSNTAQAWDGGAYSTTAAAHNVTARCTANVNFGNGSATVLTAGSLDLHVQWAVLP